MSLSNKMKYSSFTLCVLAIFFTYTSVFAQLPADSVGVVLRDVEVVSAKKSFTNPLEPATEINQAEIERLQITEIKDIGIIAPNVYMPDYGSRMTSSIYVRGLGARIDQPVVGLNVDNVPYLNKDYYDFDLLDIDRIEMVRGSAGVLNGRNSIGGQINLYTLSPWKISGNRFLVEYGKANSVRAGYGLYGRLSNKVASAVTVNYRYSQGFYRNTYNNSHVGGENAGGARWKLSWHPGSRWSLMNVAAFNIGKNNGYPYQSLESGKIDYNDPSFYKRTTFSDGLTVSYTGNRIIATSVTSFQYANDNMTLDQDFLPEDYFTLTQKNRMTAFTEDLYTKGVRGRYNWLLGVFGFVKNSDMHAPVNFKDTGLKRLIEDNVNRLIPAGMHLSFDERNLLLDSNFDLNNRGFAIYHQSSVSFGKFIAQLGLRWDIERVSLKYRSDADAAMTMYRQMPTGAMIPLATQQLAVHDNGSLHTTFNEILPQAAIGYRDGAWNISARVAKGYKAGGYNTQMFSDILQQQLMEQAGVEAHYDISKMLTYKPETSWTYELTGQYEHPSRRFQAELTLFLMKVRNQQLTVFPDENTTGRAMTNAGRTRSLGLEAAVRFRPIDALSLSASYGLTHAVFTKYDNGNVDLKGKHLPFAPANTMFVSAEYIFPHIGSVTPSLNINTRGAGKIYWDDENAVSQNFYATLGASIILSHRLGSLSLWGENLTGTKYNVFYFESIGHAFVQQAIGFNCGATLRINLQ